MSNPYNDQVEEKVYEAGYDKGYEDCRSEMEMKIKAILQFYLYNTHSKSAFDTAGEIARVLEGKSVQVG